MCYRFLLLFVGFCICEFTLCVILQWTQAVFNQLRFTSGIKMYPLPVLRARFVPGNENHILSSSLKGFVMFITYGPGNVLRSMYCIVMVSLHLLLSS